MRRLIFILLIILNFDFTGFTQTFEVESKQHVYKEVDGGSLEMTVYRPSLQGDKKLPAIVFFFGGGWTGGTPTHFKMQAEYFASRGMIAVCPNYRTKKSHGTTPFECVKDAKSAIRYLKINATDLRVDSSRIVAAGGSAGGHLAACTALIKKVNEETDNKLVSTVPFALVLFNPVVDTGKRGYGQEKLAGREFEISPVHHITPAVPPTLIMHGKKDTTVPYENVVRFKHIMKQQGNSCVLKGYCKQTHGFFNYSKKPKHFKRTLKKTETFLEEFNLLMGESWISKYYKELKKA